MSERKPTNWEVVLVLVTISGVSSFISTAIDPNGITLSWISSWLQNLSVDMFGAIITFGLLVLVVEKRDKANDEKKRRLEEQKQYRVRLTQCQTTEEKQDILNQMMSKDLLSDIDLAGFNLQNVKLREANLENANLRRVNLKGSVLIGANLQDAMLSNADLEDASLVNANMRKASLRSANLTGVNLTAANLQRAFLAGSVMCGANLTGADLCGAEFESPDIVHIEQFSSDTVMPDGERWNENMHLSHYTDIDCD